MRGPSGSYQLLLWLESPMQVAVGRLGSVAFPAGWYVYTGSARGGLAARVARHLRRRKRRRWHIDYLLAHARVAAVLCRAGDGRGECAHSRAALALPGARVVVAGFGASDCRCPAHLVLLRALPPRPGC